MNQGENEGEEDRESGVNLLHGGKVRVSLRKADTARVIFSGMVKIMCENVNS